MQEKDIFTIIVPLKETGENGSDETNDTLNAVAGVGETLENVGEMSENVGETPKNVGETSGDVGENHDDMVNAVGDTRQAIIERIKDNPQISAAALAEEISVTQRTVERYIQELREDGVLVRHGAARGGYWEIVT
jgi:predicted HTH transcriptional regulator